MPDPRARVTDSQRSGLYRILNTGKASLVAAKREEEDKRVSHMVTECLIDSIGVD